MLQVPVDGWFHVLIETLWNVKAVLLQHVQNSMCINRNIVECKEFRE